MTTIYLSIYLSISLIDDYNRLCMTKTMHCYKFRYYITVIVCLVNYQDHT